MGACAPSLCRPIHISRSKTSRLHPGTTAQERDPMLGLVDDVMSVLVVGVGILASLLGMVVAGFGLARRQRALSNR